MCGLITVLSNSGRPINFDLLAGMTDAMEHRAPNDYGFAYLTRDKRLTWRDTPPCPLHSPGVAMGHRRLSILDVTAAGHQPFSSQDQHYWMVYNGEVYNYIELRRELAWEGIQFRTGTDTEVVLAAWIHWGEQCFTRFNGMWALVLYDADQDTLLSRPGFPGDAKP